MSTNHAMFAFQDVHDESAVSGDAEAGDEWTWIRPVYEHCLWHTDYGGDKPKAAEW